MRDMTAMPRRRRKEVCTAAILFALTLLSTTFAGFQHALNEDMLRAVAPGIDPTALSGREGLKLLGRLFAAHWTSGLPFSATLILILGTHELGHFFAGRYHRISVSLPYFIPAPTLIGTFGAVIRMRGPLWHRMGLIDTGAAGPIAGFVVAVPAYLIGMMLSRVVPPDSTALGAGSLQLGDSLLTWAAAKLIWGDLPAGHDILLHPVAFAAWIGLFVTSLNLIPMGQLDGGHIMYAADRRRYRTVARLAWAGLIVAGALGWGGWWFWAGLGYIMGVDRHPPTVFSEPVLDPKRRALAGFAAAIFILTFIPNPFRIVE